jgi:hypothetical protein
MNRNHNRSRLRISGVAFALTANLLTATMASMAAYSLQLSGLTEVIVSLAGPVLAGVSTALYTGSRGGMHSFIGGMLSIPILAYVVFANDWRLAILAGSVCALAGALTEKLSAIYRSDGGQ